MITGRVTARDRSPDRNSVMEEEAVEDETVEEQPVAMACVGRPRDPALEWSVTYNPPADRPFAEPVPGPTQRYPNGAEIREGAVFDQMFTNEMWDMIIAETSRYHDQQVLVL